MFLGTALPPLPARRGGERTGPRRLWLTPSSLAVDVTAGFLRGGLAAPSTLRWGGQALLAMYIPAHGCWFWGEGGSP